MIYVIVIGSVLLFTLLFRVIFMQKEMRRMTSELQRIRTQGTDEKLQITLGHQATENLAAEINGLIEDKQDVGRESIRSEKELTEMITSMSHDLRTPLTAIIGYVQLLENPDLALDTRTQYISIIHGRASQLQALIQNFFALSAIQSGRENFTKEPINIKEMVQDTGLSYYDKFKESGKKVEFDLPQEKSIIIGDHTACKRIVENIVLNALQHSTDHVKISVEVGEAEISFCVQNTIQTEVGLDETRLFDRLYTGDSTRKYHRGLGLPIVDRLMRQMDGSVDVEMQSGIFMIRCTWKK